MGNINRGETIICSEYGLTGLPYKVKGQKEKRLGQEDEMFHEKHEIVPGRMYADATVNGLLDLTSNINPGILSRMRACPLCIYSMLYTDMTSD